jgi:peptide/nickel transport system ATP-binding protein
LKLLDIKGLTVSYGREKILEDIDLEIETGESLAIIGESGTGKTTLALSIMRLVEGSIGGSICFDGQELLTLDEEQMRRLRWQQIAIAFQNANNVLNPVYDVLTQVTEPMIQHHMADKNAARDKARELLQRFGLPEERLGAYPHQLSGGEQQIVLLTMALANDPRLLILDEPLSSLDAATRACVSKLLEEMDGQRCRLITSHDLDTASSLSQRMAVLYGGRIVETGPTQELLAEPRHPYTRALIRAYPNMTTAKDLQGIKGRLTRHVSGCPFHPRCTQAIDICRTQIPPLAGDGPRQVACHRDGIITLLATEKLSKSFGELKAVDGVDLRILAGETLALVGQTGCGKTTLAKTIMGLHPATSGAVYVEGVRINERNQDFYKKVQMVFQTPASPSATACRWWRRPWSRWTFRASAAGKSDIRKR